MDPMGITEEVSCHAVGLRNASDQHQLEEKIDPQLNWQVWEGQGRTCNDLLESEVMNSQIDDVCDDVHASLSRRAKAEETPDGISGRNIDVISFSVVESDVIAQDGVVSYSVLAGADVKNEKACADGREEHLVRGFGDTAESATLGLSVSSLDNSKVIGTQGLYVQLYSEPKYCHTAVAVPIPIESNNLENGVAYDVSTFCPSACEAQEAQEGELCPRQSPNVPGFRSSFPTVPLAVDFKSDGDKSLPEVPASFSVLPPPNEPKVEANEGQDAGPSMHLAEIEQEGSRFSGVNIEGSSNLTGWLQTPQARGKAVVRRGRPRPWPTESREVTRKRVRIDELYDDASPSTELMVFDTPPPLKNSVSQEGREEFARTYEAHDSNVPEPALLPSMGAEPFVLGTSAAPEKDQTHTQVSMTLSSVVDREEIPVKALETILRVMPVTRCGGITLHGNQCTHNVKDGSGFCVKHTKHDIDYRQRTGLECSGTSNRGGMHTPFKSSEMFTIRCRGNTLHGTQCTHSVRDGALYCLKHGDQAWGPPAKRIENKTFLQTPPALTIPHVTPLQIHTPTPVQMPIPIAVQMPTPRPVQMSTPVPVQIPTPRPVQMSIPIAVQMPTPRPLQMCTPAPVQMPTPRPVPMSTPAPQMPTPVPVQNQAPTIAPASAKEKDDDAAPRCIGRTRRTEEQCSFRPKRGSLFCERHARQFREKRRLDQDTIFEAPSSSSPSASLSASLSLKRRRSQEGVNTGDMNSTRERRSLSKARDMLTDIINAGQLRGKAVSTDGKDLVRWVCEEATRDAVSGEALLNLLSEEKERLRKVLIEDRKKSSVSKPPDFWQTKFSPNLARMSLETLGGQKVCVKRDKENKLQTSASGRSSSEAWVTSESCPSSAQMMKQGSEYGRDVVSNANFAQQVRVGIMEFSNPKEGVRNDLLSSDGHAVGGSSNADTSSVKFSSNGNEASRSKFTCKICGKKFNLLPDLGRHHQAAHPKPNSKLATNILVSQGVEVKLPPPVKRTPLPNPATANSPPWKMIPLSELCTSRLNFENAKQDEHQRTLPGHVLGTQPQSFNFRHLKTIAREKKKTEERIMFSPLVIDPSVPPPVPPPGQPPGPEVAIMKRRRRQKRMEALQNDRQQGGQAKQAKQIVQAMKAVKQIQQERYGSNGQLVDVGITKEDLKAVAKMPPQRASNPTGWPASTEMLDAVRVACCKDSWYRELAKKHANIHKDLHLQAIALCTVMGVDMQWQADAFVCPNQCSPFHTRDAAVPGLEVDMAGFSETPFKSQADHFNDTGRTPLETVNIKDVIKGKHIVIHEDLSNGQETVPIPCVMDEDASRPCSCADCRGNGANTSVDIAGPWKSFSYINKRLLEPSLGLDTESSKLGCACGESRCNPGQCDHVSMFDNDNGEACDKSGAAIRGRFPYDEQGRIILEEGYMVYECNSSCSCLEDCQNRVLQKGVRVKLEVYKSRHKGWAVRAAEPIPSGTFVCEYIGEVVNDREANQRGVRYDQDGCSYLYDIDAHLDMAVSRAGAKPFVIDATKHGNVARFINHSCAPNLINYEVLVESMDCQLAHIGFFANRDIGAGEELAYDYRYKLLPGKGTACHCGASTCRGRLY